MEKKLWLFCFLIRLVSHSYLPIDSLSSWLIYAQPSCRSLMLFIVTQFLAIAFTTGTIGLWLPYTLIIYLMLGFLGTWASKKIAKTISNQLVLAGVFIILYDCATGLILGPLLYGQPFIQALIGQIPFTLWHLITSYALLIYFIHATNITLFIKEKRKLLLQSNI